MLLEVSIARFTYVPDEHYDTIEAAFAAKSLAAWTPLIPHSHLTLTIEEIPDKAVMKCLDGQDVRVHPITHDNRSGCSWFDCFRTHGTCLLLNEIRMTIHHGVLSLSNFLTLFSDGTFAKKRFSMSQVYIAV
jgi:hypothetical protein